MDIGYACKSGLSDTNDCCVRALMMAAGITYEAAHEFCKQAGRKLNDGMRNDQITKSIRLAGFNVSMVHIPGVRKEYTLKKAFGREYYYPLYASKTYNQTVNQFIAAHPVGTFIVSNQTHAFTIIDGVVFDWSNFKNKKRRNVRYYWQLK